jgi:hypothetical protein
VDTVCAAAADSGCRVLLIDTYKKDGSNLLDFLSPDQLNAVRTCSARQGLQLALAGQIKERDLAMLRLIGPEIIAVRGAVCEGGQRTAAISEDKVRAFVESLEAATISAPAERAGPSLGDRNTTRRC